MKKSFLLIAILISLAVASACVSSPTEKCGTTTQETSLYEPETTQNPEETEKAIIENGLYHVISSGIANFKIVRAENADSLVKDLAVELRNAISDATGIAPDLTTDWVKPGEVIPEDAPEILVGVVDREASKTLYAEFENNPERNALGVVMCSGKKIVIFGTDSTMVRIATEWFIDNIVENSEYAKEGSFVVPSDISYSIDGNSLAPSYFIESNGDLDVNIEFLTNITTNGNYRILQGACTDGKYAYIVLENQSVSPSTCKIRKIDIKSLKTVKESDALAIDHGNDLCYNSKTGMIVAVHNAPNRNKISFIDPETLQVKETKTIGYEIYSITYNEKLDRYALGISYGYNFVIVDSEFNYVGKKIIIGVDTGYTKQGMDSDDKYLYFVQSWDNAIVVYDWSGNYVTTINFNDKIKDESEGIFHIGGSFYVTFNIDYVTRGALYKVDIIKK